MSSKPVRVLVVDDDAAIRRTLRGSLAAQGYLIEEARSGEEAIETIGRRQCDLVLLDINMPGMGGLAACRQIRSLAPQAGIVMITVCDTEDDKVYALEAGADEYITKPFSFRELTARLRAILRRLNPPEPLGAVVRVGELELDVERRSLRRAGLEVHLSPTEFSLLSFLMQRVNVPIEHSRLLRAIWGPEYGAELEYLRTYIKRLRRKIESDAVNPEYLLTIPWMGYRFNDPSQASPQAIDLAAATGD